MQLVNWRKIDKFYLSGGWNDVPENAKFLAYSRIKAVLDLQYFVDGFWSQKDRDRAVLFIREELAKYGIDYLAIDMYDSEHNLTFDDLLDQGTNFLTEMEEKYPEKRDGILVKCAAGISRSATQLINHLCISRRMSYVEALNYIREKEHRQGIEFGASPNYFFAEQLKKKFK